MSLNNETPVMSQKGGILAFAGIVLFFAVIIIVFVMRSNTGQPEVTSPVAAPTIASSELLPILPNGTSDPAASIPATVSAEEYNNNYIPGYKEVIESYLIEANSWNYLTDVELWRTAIKSKYASSRAPYPDDLGWLTDPMMVECSQIDCQHNVTVKFVEETAPGGDSVYAAYYVVTTETVGTTGATTEDTLWLVQVDSGDPAKIVTAEKQDSPTPPQD